MGTRLVDEVVDTFSQATEFTESTPNAETMSLEDACTADRGEYNMYTYVLAIL